MDINELNIVALKKIGDMNIDAQYVEQLAVKLFSTTQTSDNFQTLCVKLRAACGDLQQDIETICKFIPLQ